jgi:hypothetical protein
LFKAERKVGKKTVEALVSVPAKEEPAAVPAETPTPADEAAASNRPAAAATTSASPVLN